MNEEQYHKSVRTARITMWIVSRATRNTGLMSKLCRFILSKVMKIDPDNDFMKDSIIDTDLGYSVEALEKFERGED